MLIEFHGLADHNGIRVLTQNRLAHSVADAPTGVSHQVAFWAVLEEQDAATILSRYGVGMRQDALKLLEESAVSLGTIQHDSGD